MNTLPEVEQQFLLRAISLGTTGMQRGSGGPFGCVIVKEGNVVAEGYNQVLRLNDPTAHAEIVAIRSACAQLKDFQLTGCDIYASCEPCPMCLGAIYWARPRRVIYANTRQQAAAIEFDDQFIYEEIEKKEEERAITFIHYPLGQGVQLFDQWKKMGNKRLY